MPTAQLQDGGWYAVRAVTGLKSDLVLELAVKLRQRHVG